MMRQTVNGSKRLIGLLSIPTIAVLGGTAAMALGLWMVYAPLAYIVVGGLLLSFGLWLALVPGQSD